jgi:2-aminoadipate transaminase
MAEFSIDRFVDRYATRAAGMTASEVRALFAVAARPEVVSLAGGMPFVQALPVDDVLAVAREVLGGEADVALQYGGGQGSPALRDRITMLMAEEGIAADPEDVVVTTGAQQALDLLGKLFIDPGDLIAVEAPAYVGALTAFGAYEPRFLPIEVDDDGMIVEHLEQALVRGERPAFVYTVPNFGNPAGVTMSGERRRHLVALCREAGIPIIEDNPYGLLRFEGEPEPCLRSLDPENVIYLGTVSKTFSPGVRVGWALAEPSVMQRLVLAKEAADLCGSNLTMLLTERWFADEQRWRSTLAALVDAYRSRRNAMLEALAEHLPADASWTHPAGGFYVWVTLPPWFDAKALLAAAVEHRVAYVPGTAFYPDGRGADRMRLAFCYPPEDRIREGVALHGALLHDEEQLYRSLRGEP